MNMKITNIKKNIKNKKITCEYGRHDSEFPNNKYKEHNKYKKMINIKT